LRDRLRRGTVAPPAAVPEFTPAALSKNGQQDEFQELKRRLHRDLISKLNFTMLEEMDDAQRREQVESLGRKLLSESTVKLTRADEERLVQDLLHDTFDLGPITPFLLDEEISDILVNTHRQVYVERLGRLEITGVQFRDDAHLRLIIDRIISRVGRRIDESTPLVDARLPDGSRVNAIIPPAALDGPILSIRRFRRRALSIDDMLELKTLTPEIAEFLIATVR